MFLGAISSELLELQIVGLLLYIYYIFFLPSHQMIPATSPPAPPDMFTDQLQASCESPKWSSGPDIKPGLSRPQQALPIQDVAHAECDPPKWLTVSPQGLCETGNCAARKASKAMLTHGALKQQGPSIQPGSLLCERGLLSLPPVRRAANAV